MLRRRLLPSLVVLALSAAFLFVHAPHATAQTSDRERAIQLVDDARAAESRGDTAEAIRLYHQAFQLSKDPGLAFNLAVHYDSVGDFTRAWFYANAYLELFPGAPDRDDVRSFIDEWAAQLPTTAAQLIVESSPAGAEVWLVSEGFEEMLGTTPLETWLTPGIVTIELRRERYETQRDRFNAVAGLRLPLDMRLERIEEAPTTPPPATSTPPSSAVTSPAPAPSRVPGIALTSVGGVLMISAIPFALAANTAANDHQALVNQISQDDSDEVASSRSRRLTELTNRNRLMNGLAIGSVAAGAVVTGVGLYLLLRRPADASQASRPWNVAIAPELGGASVWGSFSF